MNLLALLGFNNVSNKESNKLISINIIIINNKLNQAPPTTTKTNNIKPSNRLANLSKTQFNVSKYPFFKLIHVPFIPFKNSLHPRTQLYVNLLILTDMTTTPPHPTNNNNNNIRRVDTKHVSLSDHQASIINIKMGVTKRQK